MTDLLPTNAMLKVTWHESGIDIAPETTYDEWQEIGKRLLFLEKNIQFAIGDWLNFGEHTWGEKYAQAIEETLYAHGTLRNMAYVAKRFDLSLRSDKLTYSHYKEVASLDDEIAQDVLRRAIRDELSVSQVKRLIESRGEIKPSLFEHVAALEEIIRFFRRECSESAEKLIADYEERYGWKT